MQTEEMADTKTANTSESGWRSNTENSEVIRAAGDLSCDQFTSFSHCL